VQLAQQYAERLRPLERSARKIAERLRLDIVDHGNAALRVSIMKARRDTGVGCDLHRLVLMRIAQGTWHALDSQHIAPLAGLDPEHRGRRDAAGKARGRVDRNRAKHMAQRRMRGVAAFLGKSVEMSMPHGFMLITQCSAG